MPVEIAASSTATAVVPFDTHLEIHPSMRRQLQVMGLTSAADFLNLPGEIISGHPDRHVMRVHLPDGSIGYLKKEHRIRWKDRWTNWSAGFGWISKSVREGRTLQQVEPFGITPPWLAFGEDDDGRAFLLIGVVPDTSDLRRVLNETSSDADLPIRLGRFCAELHNAGIDHPDLYAKHFLINHETGAVTLLDWQRCRMDCDVSWPRRVQALAALAATLPFKLHSRWCARFLWAYRRIVSASGRDIPSFASHTKSIEKRIHSLSKRRGIREQRQPPLAASAQRLIWLGGEAVGAVPEVADELRSIGLQSVLYDQTRNNSELSVAGSGATLHNGSHHCWMRSAARRVPEMRLARLLFHLQRYHLSAPKLLAYGHRRVDRRVDAFVLSTSVPADARRLDQALLDANPFRGDWLLQRFARFLATLHEAGCEARTIEHFTVTANDAAIFIPDPLKLTFRRHLSARQKKTDRRRVLRSMSIYCGRDELARFAQMLETANKR